MMTPHPAPVLTAAQRSALRARAHALRPVVTIAQRGLAPSVLAEIDRALKAHTLIKVKMCVPVRQERNTHSAAICEALGCFSIQHVGQIITLWRPPQEPSTEPSTPSALRA
jgi:RNA-binding protein